MEVRIGGDREAVASLLSGGELEVELAEGEGASIEDAQFISIYFGTVLLYAVILVYAGAVMRSTLEEKTSRIVEVVISSIRPWHLMLGKVLGVGAVGLLQVAVWTGAAMLISVLGLPALLAARPELTQLDGIAEALPGLGYLGLFFLYFIGGYFMFAAIYAAVGAMVNSEVEAQQVQLPVVALLIIPLVILMPVIQDPDSMMATLTSLVPFFSPILMFARASSGAAPVWQIGLSIILMGATVIAVSWVAGRIYKVGILMAGKRPTLPELIRWVREARS
jgi:ABC-2 type transport system permease protein